MDRRPGSRDELVLLISNQEMYRTSVAQVLGARGNTVVCLDQVPEHVDRMVAAIRPALIVLDAGIDPSTRFQALRAAVDSSALSIPVVVLADAAPTPPLPERCIVLTKPVTEEILLDTVATFLA